MTCPCVAYDPVAVEEAVSKLEDTWAGQLELTSSERGYLFHALQELYLKGAPAWKGENARALMKSIGEKLGALKLARMVSPDGTRLVSVAEHDAIVAVNGLLEGQSADGRVAALTAARDIIQSMLAELAED